jgi:hypothetical protein
MATQLNPAWQRRAVSSDHLAEASNRMPSDGPRSERVAGDCQVIPFLLDNTAQDWITRGLCKVLTQHGRRSRLCHAQDQAIATPLTAGAPTRGGETSDEGLYLLSTTSTSAIRDGGFDHVVLLVPVGLEPVLAAYQRIKLLSCEPRPDIGIVMVGPRDQHAAWRHFRKLAVGALRYLDTPLLNLGYLAQDVLPEQGTDDHHTSNSLVQLGERLLRSEFYCDRGTGGEGTEARPQ